MSFTGYCKHRNLADLTIIATSDLTIIAISYETLINVERYIFDSSLCYLHAGKKSLKIPVAIIRNTCSLRKTPISMVTVYLSAAIRTVFVYIGVVYSVVGRLSEDDWPCQVELAVISSIIILCTRSLSSLRALHFSPICYTSHCMYYSIAL